MKRLGWAAVVVGLVGVVGCQQQVKPEVVEVKPPEPVKPQREALQNFAMATVKGGTWELAKQRGHVVLLNFWATWCPPCRAELPSLISLSKQYAAKGLVTAGVATDTDTRSKVAPFVKQAGIPYTILYPKGNELIVTTMPTIPVTFLLDREGRVFAKWVGAQPKAEFERAIQLALEEKPD